MAKGIHRHTADSKQGRSMISPGTVHSPWSVPAEIMAWNKQIEDRKQAKKEKQDAVKVHNLKQRAKARETKS